MIRHKPYGQVVVDRKDTSNQWILSFSFLLVVVLDTVVWHILRCQLGHILKFHCGLEGYMYPWTFLSSSFLFKYYMWFLYLYTTGSWEFFVDPVVWCIAYGLHADVLLWTGRIHQTNGPSIDWFGVYIWFLSFQVNCTWFVNIENESSK